MTKQMFSASTFVRDGALKQSPRLEPKQKQTSPSVMLHTVFR